MLVKPKDMTPYNGAYYPTFNPALLIDTNGLPGDMRVGLIDHLNRANTIASGVFDGMGKEMTNNYFRSSSACNVSADVYAKIEARLNFVVEWQLKQQVDSRKYKLCEGMQFLKYDAVNQGKFLAHTDNAYFDANGKFLYTSPQRVLATLTFVNDDFEGGDISFPDVIMPDGKHFQIHPVAGTTIIFPADIRYTHEVMPVTKGIRYSIVGWYGLA